MQRKIEGQNLQETSFSPPQLFVTAFGIFFGKKLPLARNDQKRHKQSVGRFLTGLLFFVVVGLFLLGTPVGPGPCPPSPPLPSSFLVPGFGLI
jgi:hypothetical protein